MLRNDRGLSEELHRELSETLRESFAYMWFREPKQAEPAFVHFGGLAINRPDHRRLLTEAIRELVSWLWGFSLFFSESLALKPKNSDFRFQVFRNPTVGKSMAQGLLFYILLGLRQ